MLGRVTKCDWFFSLNASYSVEGKSKLPPLISLLNGGLFARSLKLYMVELFCNISYLRTKKKLFSYGCTTYILARDELFWAGRGPVSLLFPRNLRTKKKHSVSSSVTFAFCRDNIRNYNLKTCIFYSTHKCEREPRLKTEPGICPVILLKLRSLPPVSLS